MLNCLNIDRRLSKYRVDSLNAKFRRSKQLSNVYRIYGFLHLIFLLLEF